MCLTISQEQQGNKINKSEKNFHKRKPLEGQRLSTLFGASWRQEMDFWELTEWSCFSLRKEDGIYACHQHNSRRTPVWKMSQENKTGPKTEPCSTPQVMQAHVTFGGH